MQNLTYEFREGQHARIAGHVIGACPYTGKLSLLAWLAGYEAGGMSQARKAWKGRGMLIRFETMGGNTGNAKFSPDHSRAIVWRD
jgi:hypothetical protein